MIRPMTAADVPSVAALEKLCFSDPWSVSSIASELDNPLSLWLVWEEDGTAAAYLGVQRVPPQADVMNVAVSPALRLRGISRALFAELLAEIQRIKSEGDYEAGKALVEDYAVNIDPALHKEVLERYAALGLKPYGGFINPEITPVEKNGKVVDYKLSYADDYLGQMLQYGHKYRTLD